MMYQNDQKYTAYKYQWLKEAYTKYNRSRRHSDETKAKIRESRAKQICIGKPHSEETKKKLSMIAKNRSENHIQKIKEARKKQIISEETCKKISIGNKGKTRSAETKEKIGLAHRGKIVSDETKKLISEKAIGRTHTDESKKKMSDQRKGKPSHRKGKSMPKVVCRVVDKKEMDIANFIKWMKRNH